jgi:hypothetical protein
MMPESYDGGLNHTAASVPLSGNVVLKFNKGLSGGLSFHMWYAGSDLFDLTVKTHPVWGLRGGAGGDRTFSWDIAETQRLIDHPALRLLRSH